MTGVQTCALPIFVDEQPQQTTQPEQTQETAQGQTTETNLQPEQGTVAGEQGVSIDLEAKKSDMKCLKKWD